MSQGFTRGTPIDTDPNLALDSDLVVPSQKAIKDYVDTGLNTKQDTITLTTAGTSGAATLIGATLNIPQYSGGGITSLNGLTAATQLFSTPGVAGTAPNWDSSTSPNHLLNIPLASAASVTAGLISKTDFDVFTAKLSSTLPNTQIFVGNASNAATAVAMSGDTTISNTGAVTIANNAVTYAKMQAVSATSRLLGSNSTTTPVQEITLGTGLSMSGNTLSASGSAGNSIASLSNSSGDVSAAASAPSELNVVATLRANLKTGSCGVTFDGGGQVVQNKTAYVQMPYNGTLGAWFMVADQLGACTITVSKGTFIAFPTSSLVYVTAPAIPATNQKELVALPTYNSGMATVTAGDVLKFEISSVTSITWVNLSISIAKT
jgi:hypothetical protein